MLPIRPVWVAASLLFSSIFAVAQAPAPQYPNYPSETPEHLQPDTSSFDFERREATIPMRDGVHLHTVILVPRGAAHAPILLTRTPYSADELTTHAASAHLGPNLYGYDNATDVIVDGGYIRVIQDIRGKYGSEGDYVMNRPNRGPQNPTPVDESTDTYDSIEWLIHNIPETNGRVGILGISYDGWLPLTVLVHPHPALKVSVPMNPMVDGWMGDDWFHNGAFREQNMPYIYEQIGTRDNSAKWWTAHFDDYDEYMNAGSAGELGRRHGLEQIGFWKKLIAHPAYDAFWSDQAMDKVLAEGLHRKKESRYRSFSFTRSGIRKTSTAHRRSTRPSSRSTRPTTRSSSFSAPGTTVRRSSRPTRLAPFASARTPAHGSARMCSRRSLRTI